MIVAIPDGLPRHDVLDLASLVLSDSEYQELRSAIEPAVRDGPPRAGQPHLSHGGWN